MAPLRGSIVSTAHTRGLRPGLKAKGPLGPRTKERFAIATFTEQTRMRSRMLPPFRTRSMRQSKPEAFSPG